jgi:hypothetical protein
MYHSKVDANQPEILRCLRKAGISYKPVHQIKGFCDIVVGFKGVNYLFEIKVDHKKKLSKAEQEFSDGWKGQYHIVTSFNEILNIINGTTI